MHARPDPQLQKGDVWGWALGYVAVDTRLLPNMSFEDFEADVRRTFEVADWFPGGSPTPRYVQQRTYVNVADLAFSQLFCVAGSGWMCGVHVINVSCQRGRGLSRQCRRCLSRPCDTGVSQH